MPIYHRTQISDVEFVTGKSKQYARAHAYMQKFLALSPGSVRGLLMQLHFSTALGLEQERQNLMAQLGELEAAGKLDAGERQTLALYR